MLLRTDPWRDFDRLAARLFSTETGSQWAPVDAYRHGDVFTLMFDLPGIDPASIDVTIERNELKIEGERKWAGPEEDVQVLMRERPYGRFSRRLFVSDNLDTDHMTADYEDGVLTIRIPMREAARPRRIEVTTHAAKPAIDVASTQS
jgi:HSP20 family protein